MKTKRKVRNGKIRMKGHKRNNTNSINSNNSSINNTGNSKYKCNI